MQAELYLTLIIQARWPKTRWADRETGGRWRDEL